MIVLLVVGWTALLFSARRPAAPHRSASTSPEVASISGRFGRRIQGRVPLARSLGAGVVGGMAVFSLVLLLIDPLVAVLLPATAGVAAFGARLRGRRARRARLLDELPTAIEVLRMVVGAGLTFSVALDVVADDLGGELGPAFTWVRARRDAGESLADALETLAEREGEPLQGVLAMLVVAQRSGSPIADALERAAVRQRAELRRAAETRVRRLPVTMLLPLMTCVMPSFVLLTIVPLLVGGISEVQFS